MKTLHTSNCVSDNQRVASLVRLLILTAVLAALAAPTSSVFAQNTVSLLSGTLAGQAISSANFQVTVSPGAAIQGNLSVQVFNQMPGSAIAPVAATPTWGNPSTSYWQVASWVGTGYSTQSVTVNLTAPTTMGVYYIAVAMSGTYNSAQMMSGTHPAWDADWENGNKVALLPRCDFEMAAAQSWIPFNWYSPEIGLIPSELALTVIRVIVLDGGDHNKVSLLGGTLAGQSFTPGDQQINVAPGAAIQGSLSVQTHNIMPSSAIAPLAATPTWGNPSSSHWTINASVSTGDSLHTVPVSLTAPTTPGSYHLVVAMAGTYNSAQMMSGTHPAWEADWVNGNPVALLPDCDFEIANLLGWTPFNWYMPGSGMATNGLAMTTVKINVTLPPHSAGLFYSEDFSSDPRWTTDDPAKLRWEPATGTFRGTQINTEGTYAYIDLPTFNPDSSWRLEWDHRINSCDWSAGLDFGLMDHRTSYPYNAGLDMGIADSGRGTSAWGLAGVFSPAWQLSTWYHTVMSYDASSQQLTTIITNKATGTQFMAFSRTVASFPANTTRLGASRLHVKNSGSGVNPTASVDYSLDNIRLYGEAAPMLSTPLANITVGPGGAAEFSVAALGTQPLQYQWFFNGGLLPENGATLSLADVSVSDAGLYCVTVSNTFGAFTNCAYLSVLDLKLFAGLVLAGPVGTTYNIEYLDNLDGTGTWKKLTTLTLNVSPMTWIDPQSPSQPRRFYRATVSP